jgi:hypothetical protein
MNNLISNTLLPNLFTVMPFNLTTELTVFPEFSWYVNDAIITSARHIYFPLIVSMTKAEESQTFKKFNS